MLEPSTLTEKITTWTKRGQERWLTAVTAMRTALKAGVPQRLWVPCLLLGVVLGVGLKAGAGEYVTIGYDDYRLRSTNERFDLNAVQDDVLGDGGSLTQPENERTYPACSLNE